MKFRLYLGYRNGVRIPRAQIQESEPLCGDVVISPWRESWAEGRNRFMQVADIWERPGSTAMRPLRKPLFDPVVLRMTKEYIELQGFEIDIVDGEPVHYQQSWILRPAKDTYRENS